MTVVRITKRGQFTIPRELRDELGLEPGALVSVELTEDGIRVRRPDPDHDVMDWEYWAKFAPRTPRGSRVFYSEEEFEAYLDSIPLPGAADANVPD